MKKFQFPDHVTFVGAAEQLADDLVDFETNSKELTIIIKSPFSDDSHPDWSTEKWLKEVAMEVQ